MAAFFKNRIVIAVFSFALGLGCYWLAQRVWFEDHVKNIKVADSADSDLDPLAQMSQMQRQMNQLMLRSFGGFDSGDSSSDSHDDFSVREDEKNVYYELASPDGELDDVDVKVEHGQVTISGTSKQQNKSGSSVSQMSSNFVRSFPAPPNTDATKFQIDHKENRVIVSFPKIDQEI